MIMHLFFHLHGHLISKAVRNQDVCFKSFLCLRDYRGNENLKKHNMFPAQKNLSVRFLNFQEIEKEAEKAWWSSGVG